MPRGILAVRLAAAVCLLSLPAFTACRPVVESASPRALAAQTVDMVPADVPQWPSFRGPNHGVTDGSLPIHWGPSRGVRWKRVVPGEGHSSPIVWGHYVVVTSVTAGDQLTVFCFDRVNGELLWETHCGTAAGKTHTRNGYASSTPATDGEFVYAFFAPVGMVCLDLHSGVRRWERKLGQTEQEWGSASSPIVCQGMIIQLVESEKTSALFALSKTGETVWQANRKSQGCWSTPEMVTVQTPSGPRDEILVNGTGGSGPGEVISYQPENGDVLWRVAATTDIPCPTAIVGENTVVASSGSNGPIVALQPGHLASHGSKKATRNNRVLWRRERGGPYISTGVIYNQRLYVVGDRGVARSYDLESGKVIWSHRLASPVTASLIAGDGRVCAVGEQGDVFVFAAADEFELLAVNSLREPCQATPAAVDGQLIVRTARHLYCINDDAQELTAPPKVELASREEVLISTDYEDHVSDEDDVPSPSDIRIKTDVVD